MSSYEDQQRSYYTQEIESAVPNQNAIGMDLSAIRSALSVSVSNKPSETLTPSMFVSEFGARSEANNKEAACRATPYPGTAMRPDPTSRTGCGWWVGTDPTGTSIGIGAYGTRNGPMNPNLSTQIGPGKWVWDPQEAYRMEGMRAAANVRSCKDLAFVKFPNIGWCPSTNAGVLTDGNGFPAFPTFAGGDCPGPESIVMSANSCPVVPSSGQGTGPGPGPIPVSTLCTPNTNGSLSPACLGSLATMGGCGNGTLAQVLDHGDYAGASNTFNTANKILQDRGFSLHPGIISDGKMSIDNMWSSLNGLKELTVSGTGRERGAALNLCYGTPFEPCALSASDKGPFDSTCIIQTALGMGYNPNGKFLSTSAGMDYLNRFATWGELVETLRGWKHAADTETNPQKQADAIQKVYGMTVIVPKHGCNVVGVFMNRYFYPTWDNSLFPQKGPLTHFLGRYILKNGFPQQGATTQEQTPSGGFLTEAQRMITNFVPTVGGRYQFLAVSNNFARLQIDGRIILEVSGSGSGSGSGTQSQIIPLVAGQSYTLIADLWNAGGPWSFSLRMTVNGNQWAPIPADQLFMPQDRRLPMLELNFNTMPVGTQTISDTTGVIQNWRLSPSGSIGSLSGKQCLIVSGPGSNVNNGAKYLQGIRLRAIKSITMMVQISTLDFGISPSIVSFNNLPSTNINVPTLGDSNSRPYSYNDRTEDFSLIVSGNSVAPYGIQPQIGPTSFNNALRVSQFAFPKGQWFHIAFVWDEDGAGATLYVNGKPGNHILLQPYDVKLMMENICIGCDFNQNWTGGISCFRVFDYALNTESINLDYMGQKTNLAGGSTSWMSPDSVGITSTSTLNGEKVYMAFDGHYTRMLTASGKSKYCHGDCQSTFSAKDWDGYLPAAGQFTLA